MTIEVRDITSFGKMVAIPIVYDIYSKHIGGDRDGPRSDAYENFLLAWGFKRPSDLHDCLWNLAADESVGRDMLVYYLRYLCTPRIMDPSIAFEGTKDLLRERITVCQMLTEIDPDNSKTYGDEIRSITQDLIVSEGVRKVEESRIYVDTEAIREALDKPLPESYKRFSTLAAAKPGNLAWLDTIRQVLLNTDVKVRLVIPADELSDLFDKMFDEFRAHFADNTVHGLAAYLSGRIRHGILPNHLRSPLEVRHLATQRDSTTGTYQPNEFWNSKHREISKEAGTKLAERLAQFTEQIDALINMVNQRWIQIRRESTPDGLFDFNVDGFTRRQFQQWAAAAKSYEAFLEVMFRNFWDITDHKTRCKSGVESLLMDQ